MRACYEIVDCLERLRELDYNLPLEKALSQNQYSISAANFRLRLINMFDQAIDEVGFISHLPDEEIERITTTVREIQHSCFMALTRTNINEFNSVLKISSSISTLRLIGHTVSGVQAPMPDKLVREDLIADIQKWISEIEASNLPPIQKAIILIKIRSLFRFLADCSGATDEQIRRRVKSLADDMSADLNAISEQDRPMINRLIARLREPLKHTPAAVGLLADVVSLAPYIGVVGLALLQQPAAAPQLHPPSHYATDEGGASDPRP
ncbi:MAG: hypothetical protein MEQ74_03850 [Paracoccus sp.]|nr:hypothetical protein [Paracoccus sp. (in: a-proteobacteria)]